MTNGFTPLPPISCIVAPHLKAEESARLLDCMNKVRSGEKVYLVRLTNHKVTSAPKRVPPKDYVEDPALRPHAHEGLLVEARINRKGRPFIRIHDEARRPPVEGREFGYTCISLDGIESFKVLGERPGPVTLRRQQEEARRVEQQAPQAVNLQAILAMQAHGMFMMGQAMVQMSQAMLGQIQPPPIPQAPPVPPQGPQAQPAPQPVS